MKIEIEDEELKSIEDKIEEIKQSYNIFTQKDMVGLLCITISSSFLAFLLLIISIQFFSPIKSSADIFIDISKIIIIIGLFFVISLFIYVPVIYVFFPFHKIIDRSIKELNIIKPFNIKDIISKNPRISQMKQNLNSIIYNRSMYGEVERDKLRTYSFVSILSGFIFFLTYHYLNFTDFIMELLTAILVIGAITIFIIFVGKKIHYSIKKIINSLASFFFS